jgi:TP901 family phage tail tape measure protein
MARLTSQLILTLLDRVTRPIRDINGSLDRLRRASAANAARMEAMRGQFLGAAAAGYVLYRGLAAPINAAMKFESAMADVRKVVDFPTPDAFKEMGLDIRALSREMPMAADGIAAIVAAAGQSRLSVDELLPFAEMAAMVGVAWDASAEQTGEALAKLKTALGLTVAETGSIADAINHLGNNSAASAVDILDVVSRVGAQAEQFGLTAEQAAAFGAAMVGSGAQSEVAATSFRNMGRALTRGESATKRQSAAFQSLGLDATQVAKAMQKDAVGTIEDVLERMRALPDHVRAAKVTDLFGDEARALGPLISNGTLLADTLALIANKAEYAGGAQKEYDLRSQTSANLVKLFRNRITDLAISIGDALLPGLNSALAAIGPIVTSLSELAQRFPQVTSVVVGLTAAIVAFRVASIGFQFAGLFIKGALLEIGIAALTMSRALGRAMLAALNPINLVRAALYALRVVLIGTGVGAVLVGLGMAGAWIYQNWTGVTVAFEAFKGAFVRAMKPIMPALKPVIEGVSSLWQWFKDITGPVDDLNGKWAGWGHALGAKVGGGLRRVVEMGGRAGNWLSDFNARLEAQGGGWQNVVHNAGRAQKAVSDFGQYVRSGNLYADGVALVNSLWDGMISKISNVVSWLSGLALRFAEAVGKGAFHLYGAGKNLMQFLWNGMKAVFGDMLKWVGDATAALAPVAGAPATPMSSMEMEGFGVDGARASGGPVRGGGSYLVGERGPEIFSPGRSGFVSPNEVFRGQSSGKASAPAASGATITNNNTFYITGGPGQSLRDIGDEVRRAVEGTFADVMA